MALGSDGRRPKRAPFPDLVEDRGRPGRASPPDPPLAQAGRMSTLKRSTILQIIPAPPGYRMLKLEYPDAQHTYQCPVVAWALVENEYSDEEVRASEIPDEERVFRSVEPLYTEPGCGGNLDFDPPLRFSSYNVGMMFPDQDYDDWRANVEQARQAIRRKKESA
jgi:hypothetical protein